MINNIYTSVTKALTAKTGVGDEWCLVDLSYYFTLLNKTLFCLSRYIVDHNIILKYHTYLPLN